MKITSESPINQTLHVAITYFTKRETAKKYHCEKKYAIANQ